MKFGHRNFTHSAVFWGIFLVIGFSVFKPLFWISLGAFSHIFLDCWNLAGVRLFRPATEKIFVMASKKYRIRVGSKRELILSVVLILMIIVGLKVNDLGGLRGMVKDLMGDYNTAIHDYEKKGLEICTLVGKLRYMNGVIEEKEWLIIGKNNGSGNISIYDKENEKIIKVPEEAKFIRCKLKREDEYKMWNTVRFESPMELKEGEIFYRVSRDWHIAKAGDVVAGDILYEENRNVIFGEPY